MSDSREEAPVYSLHPAAGARLDQSGFYLNRPKKKDEMPRMAPGLTWPAPMESYPGPVRTRQGHPNAEGRMLGHMAHRNATGSTAMQTPAGGVAFAGGGGWMKWVLIAGAGLVAWKMLR